MKSSNQYTPRIVGALAVTIVLGVGGYLLVPSIAATSLTSATGSSANTSQVVSSAVPSTGSTSAASYKDGVYNATASYRVPGGGKNSIKVALTVKGGQVAAVKTANNVSESQSQYYTDSFDANIESVVVSSPLNKAYVSRVGGASLTSRAFDDALQTIVNDAKA